jgi:hypothetical protein
MPIADKPIDIASPINPSGKDPTISNLDLSPRLDDEFDIFGGRMSVPGGSSPFIKDEDPEDWFNNPLISNQHMNMHSNQRFGQMAHGSVDPSELSMHNHFNGFSNQQNPTISNSFNMGNAAIGDDELLDLDLNEHSAGSGQHRGTSGNTHGQEDMNGFFNQSHHLHQGNQQMHQIFNTNTPTGEPIQSPFLHGNFNYNNYQQSFQHMSPNMRPSTSGISQDYNFGAPRSRTSLPHVMDRKPSDSRSPMTPKTPALGGLNLGGTPDSSSVPSQPIAAISHRHQKSLSGQWDSTPGLSYVDSPTASPAHQMNHAQISEVLKSGKHASLPNKVDAHLANPAYQSQEAKRRRRRESHNMVERRRRDNINERIQELSHLVPHHRLEDEKVRKHLATNGPGPLSPTLAASSLGSQPATSLLASGRRAATGAGNITMGIPIEDKDKGPNKGDILNGSVGWCRDLMWALHRKQQQEIKLREIISNLGGTWPFKESEDEKRMQTELMDAMEKNGAETFAYSRGNGSGLRVPKHTNLAGEPVSNGMSSPSNLSPGIQAGSSSLTNGNHSSAPFWSTGAGNQNSLPFKEEDEYDMQI